MGVLRKDVIDLAHKSQMTMNGKPAALRGTSLAFMKIGNPTIGFWEFSDSAIYYVLKNKKGAFSSASTSW